MKLPDTPARSQNPIVAGMYGPESISSAIFAETVDTNQIKDIARKSLQGVLLVVTEGYKNKYKVICLNALSLHHCLVNECLVEVNFDSRQLWRHYLDKIRYFDFLPCEKSSDIDALKIELCSHFASLLLEEARFSFCRRTRYFFELEMA